MPAPAMSDPLSLRTLRSSQQTVKKPKKMYILVMGITGAGKSTFISTVTENADIPIGTAADLEGGK